jgi:hypothetical protein
MVVGQRGGLGLRKLGRLKKYGIAGDSILAEE